MNFSLIKKVVAGMMSAVILSTSLVVTISAAPSNILITPDTEIEKGYISTMGGAISTVEGKKIRYTDQTSYVVYKIPLNKSATKANLVIEVSQNYV
ncbi:MAG: hypothetical protein K0R90_803, partial [Oscillospiraceae bacterium]|nr:hypothetical protein [Oscillospiraceae bacterium]